MKCDIDEIKTRSHKAFVEIGAFNKDKKLIGIADASILKTDKKFVWLHELAVRPDCRRHGIGEALVSKVAEIGEKANAELIYAYPAEPAGEEKPIPQEALDAFYKNQGFKPCNAPEDVATITDEGLFKRGVCLPLKKD